MALTGGQVWQRARDEHPALSALNAPWPLAVRKLGSLQRDLVSEISVQVPGYYALVLDVALPLADFDAGIDLATEISGGWDSLWEAEVTIGTQARPATFRPWEQRRRISWNEFPAWTFRNNTIFLLDDATRWGQASNFALTYTPLVADPATLTTPLVLDDDTREYLVAALAAFYLARLRSQPAYRVDDGAVKLALEAAGLEKAKVLARAFALKKRQKYYQRDVTPRA